MNTNNDAPAPKEYPSQGVPTKVDRRVLPLLRMLKEWSGVKQYRMLMVLTVNEVRAHPELVAALPPAYLEALRGLEEEIQNDLALYARWQAQATPPAGAERPGKGKKKT